MAERKHLGERADVDAVAALVKKRSQISGREREAPRADVFNRRRRPMGRMTAAREIAEVVVFLASEKASYVTGATLSMDGGSFRSFCKGAGGEGAAKPSACKKRKIGAVF